MVLARPIAIDARSLWDRDTLEIRSIFHLLPNRNACSIALGSRPTRPGFGRVLGARSQCVLDRFGIETSAGPSHPPSACVIAMRARSLWDRDARMGSNRATTKTEIAMRARSLWDRDIEETASSGGMPRVSQSMLDRFGIETISKMRVRCRSRQSQSMLDRFGIETLGEHLRRAHTDIAIDARSLWDRDQDQVQEATAMSTNRIAIDARSLWDRDQSSLAKSLRRQTDRNRCSIALGSRRLDGPDGHDLAEPG